MAASTPTHIEPSPPAAPAAADPPRKLPIKRKKAPHPTPIPSPGPPIAADHGFDEDDDGDDDDFEAVAASAGDQIDVRSAAAAPFRFQRVWSESEEIRFLQGLLGCWSQGLVFPRDLNLFFDRFSESMPQPYTRSQLSEKLRRLRKKFRVTSARVARGHDPARLAPHDRDVLHLCTRLWHPSYAASSPFSAPDVLAPGGGGNKRRRPNPRPPSGQDVLSPLPAPPSPVPVATLPPPPALFPPTDEKVGCTAASTSMNAAHLGLKVGKEPLPPGMGADEAAVGKDETRHLMAKIVLSVFDACLAELKVTAASQGLGCQGNDLEKRWQEQRVSEMDVLARRLRMVLEKAIQN
ncbi:uncharacterized protein LOC135633725 [Musa acuminata AAA Group]|uniref:uncharacterized protein LOC135633725 n=1 Tax=Musa acuminata AAA Group TaxID=214697 RepID=UPI0031D2986A